MIGLLGLYRALVRRFRRLRGLDDEDVARRRVIAGDSWDDFCNTLKAAGASISGLDAPLDPMTQAEGYRYLTRLARAGLEAFVEFSDPRSPALRRMVHETVKMGSDNPDNHYYNAVISGAHTYRLTGRRGSVNLLTFSTQKGGYGQGAGLPPTGFLDSTDLETDADGSFEIVLSCTEQPGNWLRMEPETGLLIVRQTFLDRTHETPAELHLERTDGDGLPAPLSCQAIDDGLRNAANLVAGASLLFAKWARDFRKHENNLPLFDPDRSTAAGGDPNIAYYHSYWRLTPDQALVIEVEPPECQNWNFQLNNHWMESLDYRHFRIHLNKHTARTETDGTVRIVVAHRDPGHPNWIDTVGHTHGTMSLRWIHANHHPQPRTRVVPFDELS